jgi:hypothetical protein
MKEMLELVDEVIGVVRARDNTSLHVHAVTGYVRGHGPGKERDLEQHEEPDALPVLWDVAG